MAFAADESRITPVAIRAAQVGLLANFKNVPPDEILIDQLRARARPQARRAPESSRGEFELLFTGGTGVAKDSFPNLAKIMFVDPLGQDDVCTGYFLDSMRVLTAAHCSCGGPSSYRIYRGDHPHDGDHPDIKTDETFVLAAPPTRFYGYSCLIPPENQPGRDLAILRVEHVDKKSLLVTPAAIRPITLSIATPYQIYGDSDTRRLVGAGFGFNESRKLPKSAVASAIPISSFFCSSGAVAASPCSSFREFVLADPRTGGVDRPDSCGGDSGSPIFWVSPTIRNDAEMTLFLVGIASRALAGGHIPGTMCGGGGIYTAIGHSDVVRWLGGQNIFVRTELKLDLKNQ
jgi:hypothetical protein